MNNNKTQHKTTITTKKTYPQHKLNQNKQILVTITSKTPPQHPKTLRNNSIYQGGSFFDRFSVFVSHPGLHQRNWWYPQGRCRAPNQIQLFRNRLTNHIARKTRKHVFWGLFEWVCSSQRRQLRFQFFIFKILVIFLK